MTISESLKTVSNYPIPQQTIESLTVERGLLSHLPANEAIMKSKEYQLVKADILNFVASAPNISEGGVSFSLSTEERNRFSRKAREIYLRHGDTESTENFGYVGENL